MRHIVSALLVRDRTVLLTGRGSHRKACSGLWSFPSGHVEAGETLAEALIRELLEEIKVAPVEYVSIGSLADPNAETADPVTYHMYAVTAWDGGEPNMVGDEHTAPGWIPMDEAATLCDSALEEYRPLLRVLVGT